MYNYIIKNKVDGERKMNICFFMGKIVSDIDFQFIIHDRRNISIAIFEVELKNKSKITVVGYNELADICYSHLNKDDKIILQGYLKNERRVVLENIRLLMFHFDTFLGLI